MLEFIPIIIVGGMMIFLARKTWKRINGVKAQIQQIQDISSEISSNCESVVVNADDDSVTGFIEYLESIQVPNTPYCWNRLRATNKAIQESQDVSNGVKRRLRTNYVKQRRKFMITAYSLLKAHSYLEEPH